MSNHSLWLDKKRRPWVSEYPVILLPVKAWKFCPHAPRCHTHALTSIAHKIRVAKCSICFCYTNTALMVYTSLQSIRQLTPSRQDGDGDGSRQYRRFGRATSSAADATRSTTDALHSTGESSQCRPSKEPQGSRIRSRLGRLPYLRNAKEDEDHAGTQ